MMLILYCVVLVALLRWQMSDARSLSSSPTLFHPEISEQHERHTNLLVKRSAISLLDEWLEDSTCQRTHLPLASNHTLGLGKTFYSTVCDGIMKTVSLTSEERTILKPYTVGMNVIGRCPYRTKIAVGKEAGKTYGLVSRECLCQDSACTKEKDASCVPIFYGTRAFAIDCLCVREYDLVVAPTIPVPDRTS